MGMIDTCHVGDAVTILVDRQTVTGKIIVLYQNPVAATVRTRGGKLHYVYRIESKGDHGHDSGCHRHRPHD